MRAFVLLVLLVVGVGMGYIYLDSHPAIMQKILDPMPTDAPSLALPKGSTYKCDHSVPAFSREGSHRQIGTFMAGSKLLLEDTKDVGDMRPVCFVMEDGTQVLALCKLRDLRIKAPAPFAWHAKGEEHQTVSNTATGGVTQKQIREESEAAAR